VSAPTDDLGGFTRRAIRLRGASRDVYVGGDGPAVIVMHEIPGLHPGVLAFARRLHALGLSTYVPSLLGEPGRPMTPAYAARSIARACVAREFTTLATGATSPIVDWLRALAALAHRERGGPGVGALGMCLTGGFALAMLVEPAVIAPVLSQPSLPFAITPAQRRDLGLDEAARAAARARTDVCVLGLRFTGDRLVPPERFAALRELLDDRFLAVEIDSSPGNPHRIGRLAHAVLTHDLVDRPGHPTRAALDRVLAFFRERLHPSPRDEVVVVTR
jgi:dienelactone hydrolase